MDSKNSQKCEWRSATDPKSGRLYYYNIRTKATTWNKPLELASPEEREQMIKEKEETIQFFNEMEDNIKRKIEEAFKQEAAAALYEHARMSRDWDDEEGYYLVEDNLNSLSGDTSSPGSTKSARRGRSRSIRFSGIEDTIDEKEGGNWGKGSFGPGNLLRDTSGDPGGILYEASEGRSRAGTLTAVRRVRTISTIDDEILLSMQRARKRESFNLRDSNVSLRDSYATAIAAAAAVASRKNSEDSSSLADTKSDERHSRCRLDSSPTSLRTAAKEVLDKVADRYPTVPNKLDSKDVADLLERVAPNKFDKNKLPSQQLQRRNSTGTIFVDSTMSQQDNNATIECVCVVIRAHMIDAAKSRIEPLPKYDIFKEVSMNNDSKYEDNKDIEDNLAKVPSLNTVKDFFQYVFSKSQLESDCIIMALIYCERLVKETKGRLCIRYDNWRAILFACLVMASKVWDDLSMWNVDFSQVYPSFDLIRINNLELALLEALKYSIRVPASEYAKYYFHLRSLMARLGLEGPDHKAAMKPLDVMGAKKLQLSTEKYFAEATEETTSRRRVKSVHTSFSAADLSSSSLERGTSYEPYHGLGSGKHSAVGLEQLIHSSHLDADGQVHANKKSPSHKFHSSSSRSLRK